MTEAEWLTCADPQPLLEFVHKQTGWRKSQIHRRKPQLFACACCRRIWHLLTPEHGRTMVELAECFADGLTTRAKLKAARVSMPEPDEWARAGARVDTWYARRAIGNLIDVSIDACGRAGSAAGKAAAAVVTEGFGWDDVAWDRALRRNWVARGWPAPRHASDWEEVRYSEAVSIMCEDSFTDFPGWARERRQQADFLRDIFGPCPNRPVAIDPGWLTWNDATVVKLAQAIYSDRAFEQMPILADALEEAGCTNEDMLKHCRSDGEHVRGCWVVDRILGKE
jgi:hypothetical protein